jgi:hypothetical protein
MASDFVRRMLGEMTDAGDIPTADVTSAHLVSPNATGAKRRIPTMKPEQKRKMRNRVVDGMMGIREDRDGAVIPSDAKEVQVVDMNDHGLNLKDPKIPGQKIKNPYSGEEPLILPAASLVAPDVTPEAIHPIDPTQLPGADRGRKPASTPAAPTGYPGGSQPSAASSPAMDILMGKPAGPEPSAPTTPPIPMESALGHLPGIPSPAAVAAPSGSALIGANQPMPDHQASDGRSVLEAFSKFVPRSSMKFDNL